MIEPTFMMMVGLPSSGKTNISSEISNISSNVIIHSSDSLRKELYGDENVNNKNDELFKELHNRIKSSLQLGCNTIFDATNISYKRRKAFLLEISKIKCKKVCYLIATPYEDCIKQNNVRNRIVPNDVVKKMYMNFYIPQFYEGWDDIIIVWNFSRDDFVESSLMDELCQTKQDNPHHSMSVGDHCLTCENLVRLKTNNINIITAARFHDIGKSFTKTFYNRKTKCEDSVAHYYQHHLVGAYDALFYLKSLAYTDEQILNICNYIQWHMQPYFIDTEKSKKRFIDLVGKGFYKNLTIIHDADKLAH